MIPLYLNLPNFEIKTFRNFVYPFVKNGFYPESGGEPFIPKVLLEIDISFPVEDISFSVIKADTISLSTYILPSPGFIPTDGREIDIPNFEYRGEYGNFGVLSWRYAKGKIFVLVSAFKYQPDRGKLIYAREVRLDVRVANSPSSTIEDGGMREGRFDMLIIYPDHFVGSSISKFEELKKRWGIRVISRKVSDANTFQGRDLAERIREMIRYYHRLGVKWVLLVGDFDVIPVRYAKINAYYQYGNEIPTDLYYADLDGDWDSNGNGVFGEVADNPDLIADVFVGRLPINDEFVFDAYIDRIESLLYFSPKYLKVFALGYDLWAGGTNEGMDAVLNMFSDLPPSMTLDTTSRISLGAFLDSLRTHFFNTVVVHGNFQHFLLGGGYYTISSAVSQNISDPIFLNIIDCNNGALDKPSLVKFILNNPNSGVIGIRATSRLNSPFFSSAVDKAFVDLVFSGKSLGESFYNSLSLFVPLATTDNIYRYLLYGYVLYGDPSLFFWSDNPRPINFNITFPDSTFGNLTLRCDSGCRVLVDGVLSLLSDGSTFSTTQIFPNELRIYFFNHNSLPFDTFKILTGYSLKFSLSKRNLQVWDTQDIVLNILNSGDRIFSGAINISALYDTTINISLPQKQRLSISLRVFSPTEADTYLLVNSETLRVKFEEAIPLVLLSPFGSWITNPKNIKTDTFFINGQPLTLGPNSYISLPTDTIIFSYRFVHDTLIPLPVDTPNFSTTPLSRGIRIISRDTLFLFHSYDRNTLRPITLKPFVGSFEILDLWGYVGVCKYRNRNLSQPVWVRISPYPRKVWEVYLRKVGNSAPLKIGDKIFVIGEKVYKLSLEGVVLDSASIPGEVWDNPSYGDGLISFPTSNNFLVIIDTALRYSKTYNIPTLPTQTQVSYFNGRFYINSQNTLLSCDTLSCDTVFSDTSRVVSFSIRNSGEIFVGTRKNLWRLSPLGILKTFTSEVRQVASTNDKVFALLNGYVYLYPDDISTYISTTDGYMSIMGNGRFAVSLTNGAYINGRSLPGLWTLSFGNEPICAILEGKEVCFFAPGDGGIFAIDTSSILPFSPFGDNVLTGRSYQIFENLGKLYLLIANSWKLTLYELGSGSTYNTWFAQGGDLSRRNHLPISSLLSVKEEKHKNCFEISRGEVNLICKGRIYDVSGRRIFEGKGKFRERGIFFIKVEGKIFKVILQP
jgi:hypothetical protein